KQIQQELQNPIRIGAQNGSLDRREVARLQAQYDRIEDLERRLRRGGLTVAERMRLDQELDRLSADIYRESRDGNFLVSSPWGWINTPSFRPRGWDERRWTSTNWDNRFNDNNRWDNRWSNNRGNDYDRWRSDDNRWFNNRGNDNRWTNNGDDIDQRQQRLAKQLQGGSQDGSLSTDEASPLRNRFRDIKSARER